jgi:hypothetical protein
VSRLAIGLDGHDGSGKTTLALGLAGRLGGTYARPFSGAFGAEFLAAGESGDVQRTIELGRIGIERALASAAAEPVVLDRSWLTVASLVPWSMMLECWTVWIPTVLCYADLPTTLSRLERRTNDSTEPTDWHEHYLQKYLESAAERDVTVLRTDDGASVEATLAVLEHTARNLLKISDQRRWAGSSG